MLFAEREYEIEGTDAKLVLQISEPRMVDGDWVCEYRITGPNPEDVKLFKGHGVDKLQAVTSAFRRIAPYLERLSQDMGRRIMWLGNSRYLI